MKQLFVIVIFFIYIPVFAKSIDNEMISSSQVNRVFNFENNIATKGLLDIVDKEEKIASCISNYKKESKSYTRDAQDNLFNLIRNFDGLVSKMSGKKALKNTTNEEKIEILSRVQCEAYYKMGVIQ